MRRPLFPRQKSVCLTYIGEPLQMPTIDAPTVEQVDEWHAKYVAALRDLFEKNQEEANAAGAGEPGAKLEIW